MKPDQGGGRIRASVLQLVLCVLPLVAAPAAGLAQQPAKDWRGIESLRAGSSIRVTLSQERFFCAFDSADEDGLVCHKRQAGADHSISVRRTDIRLIRGRNATGSVIGGALIGAGVGAGVGAIVDSGVKNPGAANNAKFTGGLARAGGLLGALFGIATEFVPGKLLYRGETQHP